MSDNQTADAKRFGALHSYLSNAGLIDPWRSAFVGMTLEDFRAWCDKWLLGAVLPETGSNRRGKV